MSNNTLFISDEALQKFGYRAFADYKVEDFERFATEDYTELEDGMLVTRDDMYDIYLCATQTDEVFNNIDDLRNQIEVHYYSTYYNMRAVCEKAGINYGSVRNAFNKAILKDKTAIALLEVMKELAENINIITED